MEKKQIRILVLGGNGTVGHKIYQVISQQYTTFATFRKIPDSCKRLNIFEDRSIIENIDIFDFYKIKNLLDQTDPKYVINCIGIVKQSIVASDPVKIIYINALFPHLLANECEKRNIKLIHFTSDCVFNGKKGSYREDDISDAEDMYGRTKCLGEVYNDNCITLRTSYIGHEIDTHHGLLEWFLSQKGRVRGFTKAIYSGFSTVELANIIKDFVIPNDSLQGLYHVSSQAISKFELLRLVAAEYKKNIQIDSDETVIIDRSLNSELFRNLTEYNPPCWKDMIQNMYVDYQKIYLRG